MANTASELAAIAGDVLRDDRCTDLLRGAIAAAAGHIDRPSSEHRSQRPQQFIAGLRALPWWRYPAPDETATALAASGAATDSNDSNPSVTEGVEIAAGVPPGCFDWVLELEREFDVIRGEFDAVERRAASDTRAEKSGQNIAPESSGTADSAATGGFAFSHRVSASVAKGGDWRATRFIAQGLWSDQSVAVYPKTTAILRRVIGSRLVSNCGLGYTYFSVVQPGTRILSHCGPSNGRIRCHLALHAPPNCSMRVDGVSHEWQEGRTWVFDDSFAHDVSHEGDSPRSVLLIDIWHPDLTDFERQALCRLLPAAPPEAVGEPDTGVASLGRGARGCKIQERLAAVERPGKPSTRFLILDAGLSTELERRGCDLSDPLWSGKMLLEEPEVVYSAHKEFVLAGADVLLTSSYQISHELLQRARGMPDNQCDNLLRTSVALAKRAAQESVSRDVLVAASIGPYGASLGDGGEYRGYDAAVSVDALVEFHVRRFELFLESADVDIIGTCDFLFFLQLLCLLPLFI
jgi:Aspartyl/Asparaginyl beta-hydroxylase/Homocysteine S-methyltransferase